MEAVTKPDRYSRQVLFAGIGEEGQQRLTEGRVTITGCGALGSLQAEMLARAGVGFLRLIDRDFVEESNLHRQVLYTEADAANHIPKAVAAAKRLQQINSSINIDGRVTDVNYSNIEDLIGDVDVVLDGTDNFETRFLINDAAVKLGKPWVYGAAVGAHGVQMTIRPGASPCLRCIFPDMPAPGSTPTCDTAGVILPIIANIVSFQVAETLKILTNRIADLHSSLIQVDLWSNSWTRVRLGATGNADCPVCAKGRFDYLNSRGGQFATALCGRNAVQISPAKASRIDLERLAKQLQNAGKVEFNQYLLRLVTNGYEITVFADARGIIKGTEDLNLARSLYARYIGV